MTLFGVWFALYILIELHILTLLQAMVAGMAATAALFTEWDAKPTRRKARRRLPPRFRIW